MYVNHKIVIQRRQEHKRTYFYLHVYKLKKNNLNKLRTLRRNSLCTSINFNVWRILEVYFHIQSYYKHKRKMNKKIKYNIIKNNKNKKLKITYDLVMYVYQFIKIYISLQASNPPKRKT